MFPAPKNTGTPMFWLKAALMQVSGPIYAKSDQVWLTDGLVKDRLVKPKRRRKPVDSEADT
jgi:hypothetical protein